MLLLVLAGCAQPMLTKEGATQDEFNKDLAQCRYEADIATQSVRDALERGLRRNDLATDCMKLRGYRAAS
jgi:hypothetical protein